MTYGVLAVRGLFLSASSVNAGAGWGAGISPGEDGVDDPGSKPVISARRSAECCLRIAKARKDRNIASCSSRFGSLCSLVVCPALTGAAEEQQKMEDATDEADIPACMVLKVAD